MRNKQRGASGPCAADYGCAAKLLHPQLCGLLLLPLSLEPRSASTLQQGRVKQSRKRGCQWQCNVASAGAHCCTKQQRPSEYHFASFVRSATANRQLSQHLRSSSATRVSSCRRASRRRCASSCFSTRLLSR